MKFLSDLRLLLLGLWLGAAVFFIAVAQSAFAVLPSREMAGSLVSRTLAILNYSGLGVAVILIVTSIAVAAGTNKFMLWVERALLILIAVACAVAQFVIAWWMLLLRTQMGRPIDEVPADDPLRLQFNDLHQWSTWTMTTAMAAGLIAFFLIANRRAAAANRVGPADLDFNKKFKI
ncbi:MAG: DUF4149 domain-containing protein [Pyrinomonadaceae bacterium]